MLSNLSSMRVAIFGRRGSSSESSSPNSAPTDTNYANPFESAGPDNLESTLNDKKGRKLFREYLRTQFCSEVLQFYEAVEELEAYVEKKIKPRRSSSSSEPQRTDSWPSITPKSSVGKKVNKMTKDIYNKFVSFDASFELNITSEQRKRVGKLIEESEENNKCVPFTIFSELLNEIFMSMQRDNWPKFIQTESYKTWKETCQQ